MTAHQIVELEAAFQQLAEEYDARLEIRVWNLRQACDHRRPDGSYNVSSWQYGEDNAGEFEYGCCEFCGRTAYR